MSAPRIVVLGAGTGGTMVANRLRRWRHRPPLEFPQT